MAGPQGLGRAAISFRLRDWLISRQRYWGAPIPIIHCPSCGEVPVPERDLPVLLPDDVDFPPGGVSPLARHEGFVNVDCPSCGGAARRDTDTMDTFVDSSWYFLRYCSPHRDDVAFETDDVERWMPVDQYTGGVEHAILHLLYSRFVTKTLHDMGLVSFVEPFSRMMNQGQVIFGGASMSKSKGNIVEPMPIVERWGADTLRLTMLFAGPFEDDIDWMLIAPDPSRPPGVHGWLGRAWRAVRDAAGLDADGAAGAGAPSNSSSAAQPDELTKLTHRTIQGVTDDMERYRFNVAISKLMVLTNEIRHTLDGGGGALEASDALVRMMAPMAPFVAEELWRPRSWGTPRACTWLRGRSSTRRWPGRNAPRWSSRSTARCGTGWRSTRTPTRSRAARPRWRRTGSGRRSTGGSRLEVIVRPPKLVSIVTG